MLCARMLGCEVNDVSPVHAEVVSTGLPWLIVMVESLQVIKTLRPDQRLIEETCRSIGALGLTVFSLEADDPAHAVRVRTFIPGEGIPEDVVCGSGNGCIAAFLAHHGLKSPEGFSYVAEQGHDVGRPGFLIVRVRQTDDGSWCVQVGGQAVEVMDGTLTW